MIKRDQYGIIVQHRPNDLTYMDGGDSARAVGMMAMSGSAQDKFLINHFETFAGLLCRHPYQDIYKNTNNFTRDQLLQAMAGINEANHVDLAKRIFWSHVKRGFLCQNTHTIEDVKKSWWDRDILTPSHIGTLLKPAKIYWLYWMLPLCWAWLVLDVAWSTNVKPNDESNQIIAMCSVAGDWALKLYCANHPNWKKPIIEYWSRWRDQKEIGDAIVGYIENRIKS